MSIANITVSLTEPVITVSQDLANVSVTTPISNIVVSTATVVSNSDVRTKISVQNESGFGSLAYDSTPASNGIIQYTGVSNSEIISTLSGGNGITVGGDGTIGIDLNSTLPYSNYATFSGGLRINGVTTDTANSLVARDAEGDFAASNITLGSFIQPGGGLNLGTSVNLNALGDLTQTSGNIGISADENITIHIATDGVEANRDFVVKNNNGEIITAFQPLSSPSGKTVRIGNTAGDGLLQAGNITTYNDMTATGNVSGTYILGDGSQLTGIDSNADTKAYIESTGLDMTANITSTNNISTSLDMSARYFLGDGSLLTGIGPVAASYINDNGLVLQHSPTKAADNPPIFTVKGAAQFQPQPDDTANSSVIFTTDIEIGASSKIGPQLAAGDINFGIGNIVLNKDQTVGTDATILVDNSYDTNIEDAWIRYDDSIDAWQIKGSGTSGGINDNIIDQGALTTQLNPVVHVWDTTDLANDIKPFIVSDTSALNTSSKQSNLLLTHNYASSTAAGGFEMTRTNMQGLPPGGTNVGANKLYLYAGPAYDASGNLEHYNHMDVDGAVRAYSNVFAQTGGVEANLDITSISGNISGVGMVTTGNATVGGNLNVAGDLEVTGNINYREVTDLLVQDQTITLNFGNASAQDAQIIVDRQGSSLANVDLKWNEATDNWQFTNDGSTYYDLATSTTDLAEGTNLYYTDARVVTKVDNLTSNVTTTANVSADYVTATTEVAANSILATNTSGVRTPKLHLNTISREAAGGTGAYIEAIGDEANTSVLPTIRMASAAPYQGTDGVRVLDNLSVGGNIKGSDVLSVGSDFGVVGSVYLRGSNNQSVVNGLISNGPMELNNSPYGTNTILQINSNSNTGEIFKTNGPNGNVTITGNADVTADGNVTTTANVSAENVLANTEVSAASILSTSLQGVKTPIIELNTVSREASGGSGATIEALGDPANTSVLPRIRIQSAQQYQSADSVQIVDNMEVTGNIYNSGGNTYLPGGVALRGSNNQSAVNGLISNGPIEINNSSYGPAGILTVAGNITASHFIGDGSALTNLPTQPDLDTGNIYVGNANVTTQVTPSTNFVTQITSSGSTSIGVAAGFAPANSGQVADGVEITGHSSQTFADGTALTFSGFTNSNLTPLNGLTLYSKWETNVAGYLLYTDVGLLTPSTVITGGGYYSPTAGSASYSAGTTITPTFALADTVTIANVKVTNQIQSSAGANLDINSNTKSVVFKKDFLSATDEAQIELDAEGWAVATNSTVPTYSGSAERVAWVIEGSATAGSKVINVTTAEEWGLAYGSNNFNGTAPSTAGRTSMFTGSNPIANNYVSRTKGTVAIGQTPFPPGSIIESFDSATNTITMSQAADVDATFAWNGGGQSQTLYTFSAGAYNTAIGVTFGYFSNYDFNQLGAPDNSKVTLNYAEVNNYDRYGFGQTGPNAEDLQYSIGTSSQYTKPTYGTRGRMALNGEKSFLNTNYGMNIGEGAVTNRIVDDPFTGFGYSQLWDGTLDYPTLFGNNNLIPQMGYRQFTDGIVQNNQPHIGPRFQFMSSKGNKNDDPSQWYPRSGQELGRMGFWGSHGNQPNASTTSQPAYITVQAADDWETGSNASVYHVGTSDYNNQYRTPFMSFEKGTLILASGIKDGAQESVTFAPGVGVTNNPANVYDFNAGATGTAGWASINYENIGGQSGAELSVNNGGSLGAGTVGDMSIGVHRKDNSYSGNISSTANSGGLVYNGTGSGLTADIFVFTNNPPLINLPDATPVTASGFTGYFAPINGQVLYTQKVFGGQYILFWEDSSLTIPVKYIPSGVSFTQDAGSFEYTVSESSGVTDKEWTFSLAEQSEDLVLKGNVATAVTFTDSRTDFNSTVKLKNYTTAEVNALPSPQSGDTVFCTDASGGATIVFYNGSSWQKVSHANL